MSLLVESHSSGSPFPRHPIEENSTPPAPHPRKVLKLKSFSPLQVLMAAGCQKHFRIMIDLYKFGRINSAARHRVAIGFQLGNDYSYGVTELPRSNDPGRLSPGVNLPRGRLSPTGTKTLPLDFLSLFSPSHKDKLWQLHSPE